MRKLKLALLHLAKFALLFRIARFFTKKHPRIICYHGGCLDDENDFNSLLFLKKDYFAKRIDWLINNNFIFSKLDDLNSGVENSVIITFDDGWYSTYAILLPVLIKKNIPSTIYLSTLYYQDGTPIIPVTIRYIAWRSANLQINLKDIDTSLDCICELKNNKSLHKSIELIEEFIRDKFNDISVVDVLNKFSTLCGVDIEQLALSSRRFSYMNKEEIFRLMQSNCKVEMHGHKHEYPSGQSEKFELDVLLCRRILKNEFETEGKHYCYPSGVFDAESAIILKKIGAMTATTCKPGLIDNLEKQRYFLPRFLDGGDISDIEFESEMMGFSYYLRKFFKYTKGD